jgi:hypothetical protein
MVAGKRRWSKELDSCIGLHSREPLQVAQLVHGLSPPSSRIRAKVR